MKDTYLNKPRQYDLAGDDLNRLCLSATLYAAGRHTTAPGIVARTNTANAKRLNSRTVCSILELTGHNADDGDWTAMRKTLSGLGDEPTLNDGIMVFPNMFDADKFMAFAWRYEARQAPEDDARTADAPAFWMRMLRAMPDVLLNESWCVGTLRDMKSGSMPLSTEWRPFRDILEGLAH